MGLSGPSQEVGEGVSDSIARERILTSSKMYAKNLPGPSRTGVW